jgi:hypothetical protein
MPGIIYKFNKKILRTFFALEIFGFFLTILNFIPIGAQHKLYVIPLIIGPIFMIMGIKDLLTNLRAPHCSDCGLLLNKGISSVRIEDGSSLSSAVQTCNASQLNSINRIANTTKSRIDVNLSYCPGCVSIGLASANCIDSGKKENLFNKMTVQGLFVRDFKNHLAI